MDSHQKQANNKTRAYFIWLYTPRVKGNSFELSMSQEVGSSLQKFESFLERLQNGINKGLDGELVAYKIKEVKVKREEEVEVLPTIETKEELKIAIPTFAIKL